jgi:hypothetical protein
MFPCTIVSHEISPVFLYKGNPDTEKMMIIIEGVKKSGMIQPERVIMGIRGIIAGITGGILRDEDSDEA